MARKSTPINPKTGFVSCPTAGQQKPPRTDAPIATGTIAHMNQSGKEVKKKVKG